MAIFVLNFEYGGLQSYQISEFLKMVKLCLKRPLVLNGISMSRWLHCNPPKKLTRPGFTKGYQIPSMNSDIKVIALSAPHFHSNDFFPSFFLKCQKVRKEYAACF